MIGRPDCADFGTGRKEVCHTLTSVQKIISFWYVKRHRKVMRNVWKNGVVNLSYPSVEKRGSGTGVWGTLPYAYDIKWNTPLRVFVPYPEADTFRMLPAYGLFRCGFLKAKRSRHKQQPALQTGRKFHCC